MTATTAKRRTYDGPTSEETLVSDLVALMESSNLPPWRREWNGHHGEHRNLLTGHPYRGSNPILLELGSLMRGHTLPLWLGGAQAKQQGWFPKKGTKAVRIIRPQLNKREDDNGELKSWVSYKPVAVFNAADLTGANTETSDTLAAAIGAVAGVSPKNHKDRLERAESTLENWPVAVSHGGAMACYLPAIDKIRLPDPDSFNSREAYCATWAHEQAHSTGHDSRLNRNLSCSPGSQAYAREELVAELAAVLICYRLQIGSQMANHAAYLKEWANILKEEPKALFKVLSQARQAADLIIPEAHGEEA